MIAATASSTPPAAGKSTLSERLAELLNREVPSGGLPADIGVLCHNPGTLLAALQAVRDGLPLVARVVTLTGDAITQPGNYWVRVGTSVAFFEHLVMFFFSKRWILDYCCCCFCPAFHVILKGCKTV